MREEDGELEEPLGGTYEQLSIVKSLALDLKLSFLTHGLIKNVSLITGTIIVGTGRFLTRVEEDSRDSSENESEISTWDREEDDLLRRLLERRVFRIEDFAILMRKKEGVPERRFKRRRDKGKGGKKV
ncbi:hypothetical protein HAX54_022436 [Datura stramonium]|uniref:Uncharacterized protein n=1 Tax=Datura stramonium TaxID=4076 RepID=A0ABS8UUH0_DATST|nr:hypothetical protein [Datura stramonium]